MLTTPLLNHLTNHCYTVETENNSWLFKSRDDQRPTTRARPVSATLTRSDGASASAKTRRSRGSKLDADQGRIASLGMLLNKFSPMTVAASPNRVGVVDGGKNQHGRTARGGVGGGGALPVGQAGGEGAHSRRAVRDDGLASQACGAHIAATRDCYAGARPGGAAGAQAQIRRDDQGCAD